MNPPRSPQDPLIGMELGGCRIEDVIGRGGMGAVYRARHLALDKFVALKLLAPHLAVEPEAVQRFVQEARAAAKIEHPNVVQVLNVDEEAGQHFIVMQFVEGQSLEELLQKKGKLGLKAATRIARDVACGLEALHKAGVIHRDIKPANILIQNDATVKITDFGLARNVRQRQGLTLQGVFMGTPEFVSPEQVQGINVDHRTDLYALGVTYYLMLSGTLPFQGESAVETASLHLKEAPPPLELRVVDVDPRAAAIVKRLLEKDPALRVQEAGRLRAEFEEILGDGSPTSFPVPTPAATPASTAPTVPAILSKGRLQPAAPPPAEAPKAAEAPLISSGPKRRHAADYGEIKPREFVVPPPPKPAPKKAEEDGTSTARLGKPADLSPLPTLEELSKPKLNFAPPLPPPPPKPAGAPKSAVRRRSARLGRNMLFWGIVVAAWFLFFATGALGASLRGDTFWEGLTKPFTTGDGGLLIRISTLVLGGILLAVAGFQNRREFEAAYSAGPALMLIAFAGVFFYVGALHLPRVSDSPSPLARAWAGLAAAREHPCHLFLVGAWGVVTGLALGSPRLAGRSGYAVGGLIAVLSIVALAGFGSGGDLPAVASRLRRPMADGLPVLAVAACAAVGLLLAFGEKRPVAARLLGAAFVLTAGVGGLAVGAWKAGPAPASLGGLLAVPFTRFPDVFVTQGGAVTLAVLFGFWGACLLYNRFTPAYGA